MPKISVIVPIYKVEKYLNRCVDSILNQTFTDFECILVDDGSPDNCPEICDEYAKKDKRIRVIHKPNGGSSDARNVGLDAANGEYLSFIDSDDWIHPQMLEILYDGIIKNDVLLSVCAFEQVKKEEPFEKIANPISKRREALEFYTTHNVSAVVPWSKLYSSSLFLDIRYPVGRICEDEFTTYKILYLAKDIAYFNQKLYFYFIDNDSVMRSPYTLKKLDGIAALEERNVFFREHGLLRYYQFCIRQLLQRYYWNYKKTKGKDEFTEAHDEMKRKIRKLISSELSKGHLWIVIAYLEMVFPVFQKMCAIIRLVFKKVYKTVSKNRS